MAEEIAVYEDESELMRVSIEHANEELERARGAYWALYARSAEGD